MTRITPVKTISLIAASVALLSAPALASDKQKSTPQAKAEVTANSTTALKKEFMGKHIDTLPEVESSTKAVDNPDRVICKEIEKTGSRLRKRKVCATKKEWDQAKSETVNAMRIMQVQRARTD